MSHHSDLEAAAGQAAIPKLWSHAGGTEFSIVTWDVVR